MKGAAGAVAGQLVRLPRIVPFFVLSIPARFRRKLGVALLVAVLLTTAYMLWLRDSSLVAIEKVQVSGLTTRDAPKVREALTAAARDMTTLHVDRDRLLEAASAWPVVNDLRVVTDFPHGVRIEAVERRPVALVSAGGERVPVSEDGTVIQGLKGEPKLPEVDRKLLAAAGAAPPFLLERVKTIRRTDRGLVAELGKGPDVVLGSQTRLRAKWAAAAAVMADEGAKGANYIDVRLPERPVAGGLPAPDPEPGETAPEETEPAAPDAAPLTPQPAPQAAPQALTPQAQP
jgi:cell division protein FtsQ